VKKDLEMRRLGIVRRGKRKEGNGVEGAIKEGRAESLKMVRGCSSGTL
jgi:hypothetical protein